MILRLDIERPRTLTLDEVRDFMTGGEPVNFRLVARVHAYDLFLGYWSGRAATFGCRDRKSA